MIERDGRYLITQRRETAVLPLLWEFPGGKVEADESDAGALHREVRHRLNIGLNVRELVSFVQHSYKHYVVDLYLYNCELDSGSPSATNVRSFAWVASDGFDLYPFTPADERSMSQLLDLESQTPDTFE